MAYGTLLRLGLAEDRQVDAHLQTGPIGLQFKSPEARLLVVLGVSAVLLNLVPDGASWMFGWMTGRGGSPPPFRSSISVVVAVGGTGIVAILAALYAGFRLLLGPVATVASSQLVFGWGLTRGIQWRLLVLYLILAVEFLAAAMVALALREGVVFTLKAATGTDYKTLAQALVPQGLVLINTYGFMPLSIGAALHVYRRVAGGVGSVADVFA